MSTAAATLSLAPTDTWTPVSSTTPAASDSWAIPEGPALSPDAKGLRRFSPFSALKGLRIRGALKGIRRALDGNLYGSLSEDDARSQPDESADSWEAIIAAGRVEDQLLQAAGIQAKHSVVEFGCRTGRLAVRRVPTLRGGQYIGIDISLSRLWKARKRLDDLISRPSCRVTWINQKSYVFQISNRSVDMFCAFSAFTHMETEDVYRYLKNARRIVKPGGRLLFTFLPLDQTAGQAAFLESASHDVGERWFRQRVFTSSLDVMTSVARLAGWSLVSRHEGTGLGSLPLTDETTALAGTTLVMG